MKINIQNMEQRGSRQRKKKKENWFATVANNHHLSNVNPYGIGVLDSIFYDLSLAQILLFITWKVALSSKVDKVHTRKYMLVIITSYYMVMVHNEKLDCQLIFYYNYSKALCVSHGIQDPLANVIMAMPFADIIHSIPPHQLHLIRTLRSGRHQV
eukprot:612855_1